MDFQGHGKIEAILGRVFKRWAMTFNSHSVTIVSPQPGEVNKRSEAMKRMRRNHEATFKTQMAFAAVKGDKALVEWAEKLAWRLSQHADDLPMLMLSAPAVRPGRSPRSQPNGGSAYLRPRSRKEFPRLIGSDNRRPVSRTAPSPMCPPIHLDRKETFRSLGTVL